MFVLLFVFWPSNPRSGFVSQNVHFSFQMLRLRRAKKQEMEEQVVVPVLY